MSEPSPAPSIGDTAPHDIPPEVLEVLATARAMTEVASRAMAASEVLLQSWSSGATTRPLAATMSEAAASTAEQASAQVRGLVARGETLGIDITDTALGTEKAGAEPDPGR